MMFRSRTILIAALAVGIVLAAFGVWVQPPALRLSDRYSAEERREITGVARRSALASVLLPLREGRYRDLWRWMSRNPWQTFHVMGNSGPNQLWLICGNPDAAAPMGYGVWFMTILNRRNGHWEGQ